MAKNRSSRRCSPVALGVAQLGAQLGALLGTQLGAVGCGGARGEPTRSAVVAAAPEERERRPDGVVLEPTFAVPPAEAREDGRGVVALREPHEDEPLRELCAAYVRGFAREDLELLTSLLAEDAVPLGPRAHASRAAIVDDWQRRLRARDYGRLASVPEPLRLERLERWELDQLGGAGEPPRPPEMRPGDVLVRVPFGLPRLGGERLFGEALIILVRREGGRLKIAGVQDEDAP